MGDRFYQQQKAYKPKRRLKKDVIAELTEILNQEVKGLDRCTIATLDSLIDAVKWRLQRED
jgi:hypothetical protein